MCIAWPRCAMNSGYVHMYELSIINKCIYRTETVYLALWTGVSASVCVCVRAIECECKDIHKFNKILSQLVFVLSRRLSHPSNGGMSSRLFELFLNVDVSVMTMRRWVGSCARWVVGVMRRSIRKRDEIPVLK